MQNNKTFNLHALSEIKVEMNGNKGGWDVNLKGIVRGQEIEWNDHCLFLQGVEDIIKKIRLNSLL